MITSFWFKRTPDVARLSNPERARGAARSNRIRGFSLVEITIALGIFTFAILSIIGLLSVALNTSEETQRDSSLTTLIRTLNSEVRSATTSNSVTALLNGPLYYDLVGKPVAGGNSNSYFKVTFTHSNQGTNSQTAVKSLLGLKSATNLNIWSATIAYPPPANPLKTVVLINNATY